MWDQRTGGFPCRIWNYYFSNSNVFMFDMLYHIYQNMEYVGSYISKYGKCGIKRKGGFPCRRAAVLIDSPGVLMCTRISKTNFFGGYCISHNPYPIQCVYDPICQHAKFWTSCTLSDTFNTLMFSFFCCAGISEKGDQQKKGDSKDLMMPIVGGALKHHKESKTFPN